MRLRTLPCNVHLKTSEGSYLGVADDITDLVGGTPMLRLKRLVPAGSADIFAKLEYLNPGGSVKDRAAIGIIRKAEQEGKLSPGATIVEATAGNTGIGLALIGVNRGYKVKLFVPENFSQEKVTIMRALGAEVERTPDEEGMQGAIRRAKELVAKDRGAFMAGFSGVARYMKQHLPGVLAVAVTTQGSVLGGGAPGPHKVEGIGNNFIPETFDPAVCNEVIAVTDDNAFETVKRLAAKEGVLAGSSGGAAVFAALEVARRLGPGKRVATVIPDSAERYLSKQIFEGGI